MNENKDKMYLMIQQFLTGTFSYDDLFEKYSEFYLEVVTDEELDEMPKIEYMFFSEVHDKLYWVDEKPDDESRSFGWIDYDQYKTWIVEKRDILRSKMNNPNDT
ncbi:hypothetical protein [Hirschia maritima]|uniref:hypothetical protein n=1 Tax=Hirschia maritima TaxID=1121961 RepID=UPI000367789A|nr:hypothetical protein [Hirschia maritima]